LEVERGSTRLHPLENSLWKSLLTSLKTGYMMMYWEDLEGTDCCCLKYQLLVNPKGVREVAAELLSGSRF
jgi:hypothetical protein